MALKVKAVERLVKFKKNEPGQYRYVMQPELYTSLSQTKVIKEAALRALRRESRCDAGLLGCSR